MQRTHVLIVAAALLAAMGSFSCSKKSSSPTAPVGNHSPAVAVNTDKLKLYPTQTAQISVVASDADGDQLTFAYSATGGTVVSSGPNATTATFTAGASWGPASVTVTARDGHGGATDATASMYVRNPNPPIVVTLIPESSAYPCKYIQIHASEACTITELYVWPTRQSGGPGDPLYEHPPITLAAGDDLVLHKYASTDCWTIDSYGIWVQVRTVRPEPDGGTNIVDFIR